MEKTLPQKSIGNSILLAGYNPSFSSDTEYFLNVFVTLLETPTFQARTQPDGNIDKSRLENHLDLIDSEFIKLLSNYYKLMEKDFSSIGKELPTNKDVKEDAHKDMLIRELDCAVIEYLHQKIKEAIHDDPKASIKTFSSARGVFIEGRPSFPEARVQKKGHLQVCIRDMSCIKGFFLPRT